MTVQQQISYNAFTGNGVTTVFPYQFKVLAAADLTVYLDGSPKILNAHYTVSGVGADSGGSVTFLSPPAIGKAVRIVRAMRWERLTDYQQQGDFNASTVNPDFDRPILLIQDVATQLARSISAPDYEPEALMKLPAKSVRANKYTRFNTNGDIELAELLSDGSTISQAIIGEYFYPETAAEIAAGVTPVNYFKEPGNVLRYGTNTTPGTTDMTTAIQAALNVAAVAGGEVYVPTGTYKTVSTLIMRDATWLRGDGWRSVITCASNIKMLSNNHSASTGVCDSKISDIKFSNTTSVVAGAGHSQHSLHFFNAISMLIERVHIESGFGDSDYHTNNRGGIRFEIADGFYSILNRIDRCLVIGMVWIDSTDSNVTGGYHWGHNTPCAIKVTGGDINVEHCGGIIGSRERGGIWIQGAADAIKIIGNYIGGTVRGGNNGYGIYASEQFVGCTVVGNTFHQHDKVSIYAVDGLNSSIIGNNFYGNDPSMSGGKTPLTNQWPDIVIDGVDYSPSQLTVISNTFFRIAAQGNSVGPSILERGAHSPTANRYIGNTFNGAGRFDSPAISVTNASTTELIGNAGHGTETGGVTQFTLTETGCITSPNGVATATRTQHSVTLVVPQIQGTSNSATLTLTGIPAALRPPAPQSGYFNAIDNGAFKPAIYTIDASGVLTISLQSGSLTGSGTKGSFGTNTLHYFV